MDWVLTLGIPAGAAVMVIGACWFIYKGRKYALTRLRSEFKSHRLLGDGDPNGMAGTIEEMQHSFTAAQREMEAVHAEMRAGMRQMHLQAATQFQDISAVARPAAGPVHRGVAGGLSRPSRMTSDEALMTSDEAFFDAFAGIDAVAPLAERSLPAEQTLEEAIQAWKENRCLATLEAVQRFPAWEKAAAMHAAIVDIAQEESEPIQIDPADNTERGLRRLDLQ